MATRLYVKFESPEVEQRVISEVLGVSMDQWERLAQWEHDMRVAFCAGNHNEVDRLHDQLLGDAVLNQVHSYKVFGLGRVISDAYDCAGVTEDEDYVSGSAKGDVARRMLRIQADHCYMRNHPDHWLCRLVRRPEVQGCYWC